MSVYGYKFSPIRLKLTHILERYLSAIDKLSSKVKIFFVTTGTLQNYHHHLFIYFIQFN